MFENGSQIHLLWLAVVPALAVASPTPPADASLDQEHARQLIALLDYVSSDYARAVVGGQVALPSEYEEQLGLLQDARDLARTLPRPEPAVDPVAMVEQLVTQANQKVAGDAMARRIAQVRGPLISLYSVPTAPARPPSFAQGKELYGVACAACHGLAGHSDTSTAAELDPHPPRFDDPERMDPLSPFRAFNAISFGVKGTAMPAYETLDDAQKWDLASYVFTLRNPGADPDRGRQAVQSSGQIFGGARLATLSDAQVMRELSSALRPTQVADALAWLRGQAAYAPADATDLESIRAAFRRSGETYAHGDAATAHALVVQTYLEGFEPKEPGLRAQSGKAVDTLEDAYAHLRAAIDQAKPAGQVLQAEARVDALLEGMEHPSTGGSGRMAFGASLIIILREGLEAALLVAALLGILRKTGRVDWIRWVHAGWVGALGVGGVLWLASGRLVSAMGARREEMEGVTQLVTAAFLIYASHWLLARGHALKLMGQVSRAAGTSGGASAVFGLSFLAVSRESLEVVVFYRGLMLDAPGQESKLAWGAVAGAAALLVVVLGFLRVGRRIPVRPFLVGCGAMLCALAVVMVGHGVSSLQEADWMRLTPVGLHAVPSLGIYDSLESLAAQVIVLLGLAVSAGWSALHRDDPRSQVMGGTSTQAR